MGQKQLEVQNYKLNSLSNDLYDVYCKMDTERKIWCTPN